ncbi:MAG: thiamine pyrophosphate-binding protein [Defluviitaleaceae bacterium]|nr:thiamine pyrophosphate-binding protein [Defluviitaleaceae bacterium]
MKVSDYLVSFMIEKKITDVFGYPGGMVTHLLDSLSKEKDKINAHICYHEQAAAFAACGYAQTSLKPGVSYATSGPGVTNLVTGIANAYYDSTPVIFITGQVNTYEGKGDLPLRQKGFQEMDVVSMVEGITKYCVQVNHANEIKYHLEKAYALALDGRNGPVLLDIPMDIQRTEIDPSTLKGYSRPSQESCDATHIAKTIYEALSKSKRPCIIAGAGVNASGMGQQFAMWVNKVKIPVVSSMPAVDVLPASPYYYGFIGAYGLRHANFIVAKSDLIISVGSRLGTRQTGANTGNFATNAKLLRVDIDAKEFSRKVKESEDDFLVDLKNLLPKLIDEDCATNFSPWLHVCEEIKAKLVNMDEQQANLAIRQLSSWISADSVVTTDVGQNQVWVAQSFVNNGQRMLFSSGHGAMGYSLPAAIGAYYGSGGKKVFSFCGDGGFQMNIQELQFLAREGIAVKVILLNNHALGMIRHFQEMYFDSNYMHTKQQGGYTVPDFGAVSTAYGIPYAKAESLAQLDTVKPLIESSGPAVIELAFKNDTYVFPKLAMGKLNHDQEPELDRALFDYLSNL